MSRDILGKNGPEEEFPRVTEEDFFVLEKTHSLLNSDRNFFKIVLLRIRKDLHLKIKKSVDKK